jgi:hypothetical protein
MSKLKGKYARLYVDHMPIYLKSFEMDYNLETITVDGSVYGDDFDSFESIRARGSYSLQARLTDDYRDPADSSNNLLEKFFAGRMMDLATQEVKTTPAVVTSIFRQTPAAGDGALFTRGWGVMSLAHPRDALASIRFNLSGTGPIHNGKVLYIAEVTLDNGGTTVSNGTAVNLGDATTFIRTAVHVTNFTVLSGSPTVTAKIQSDDSSGMGSPTDRLTFATISNEGQEWKEVLVNYGAGTEDWHRLVLTVGGTGSVTIGVLCTAITG